MVAVTAYRVFGIFADYDGNAPDTSTLALVPTEEVAKEVCQRLNEDPQSHTIVFVDGWENHKTFRYRPELTEDQGRVLLTADLAYEALTEDDGDGDDDEE